MPLDDNAVRITSLDDFTNENRWLAWQGPKVPHAFRGQRNPTPYKVDHTDPVFG